MGGKFESDCVGEDQLWSLVLNELDGIDQTGLFQHFLHCEACVKKVRMMNQAMEMLGALQIPKGSGHDRGKYHVDLVNLPAASSRNERGVSGVRSLGDHYTLKVTPFMDGNGSLLEVEILDENTEGFLLIGNEQGTLFREKIRRNKVCIEIDQTMDLKNLVFMVMPRREEEF
jgi:hypothetical protein